VTALPEEIQAEAQALFHDVRLDDIESERHTDFVIARVLDRGTMRSVRALVRHCGEARIRGFCRVSPQTRALWLAHFGLDEERCTPRSSPRISSSFWNP
jgi:hypothetical protein